MGGTIYGTEVTAPDGRVWAFKRDGSIRCQKKQNSQIIAAGDEYSVELVTPILTYREDIGTLQELVRRLRKAGMFASPGSGLHIHNDGSVHDARSVRNFLNIIASKNDLLYDALCVEPERTRYCKKLDADLVEWMNRKKPKTMDEIRKIWYEGYHESEHQHYHRSRYQAISLHSLYNRTYTIELRMFNSTFHAGEVRSLIVLALALNHQALTQKCASARKVQADNPKFAFRTYLNRIGLIGASSKTAASIFASICPATARGETVAPEPHTRPAAARRASVGTTPLGSYYHGTHANTSPNERKRVLMMRVCAYCRVGSDDQLQPRKTYACYGSNLNLQQMSVRCPDAEVIGTGRLENYKLAFKGWPDHAVATVIPEQGS